MIIEHVHLQIQSEQSASFEQAFQQAKHLIAGMHGFLGLQLIRHVDDPQRYILWVQWHQLEDHQLGFRQSQAYQQWAKILHPFYAPMPTVEYYQPCVTVDKT